MDLDIKHSYVLFLADIQGSSKMDPDERERVFSKVGETIHQLNGFLEPTPMIALSISYGDEVAGLFEDPRHIYQVADHLREAVYPESEVRFVVVRDQIGVVSKDIREIGGPVFKRASQQMEFLKKKNRFCSWRLGDDQFDGTLESLVELSNGLIQRMTPYQREVWRLCRKGKTTSQIAALLTKQPPSVSKAIRQGGADLVMLAEQQIDRLLRSP